MARVRTNLEAPLLRLTVSIDQAKVASAGLSNAAIFSAINAIQDGTPATIIRDGDTDIPVVVRGDRGDRATIERLASLPVGPAGNRRLAGFGCDHPHRGPACAADPAQPAARSGSDRAARHADRQAVADRVQGDIAALGLPAGHTVSLGGEIEESANADAGLRTYAPIALVGMLLLFLWQFGSLRKALIVLASMPFVVIGATLGLTLAGQPLSFSATIGILALMGIIVNNAVLLLGRIAEDRAAGMPLQAAIAHAAEMRLRPIVMTKLVCISGLAPLYLFGGDLWRRWRPP
jgi:multidrug efflux pump subunit AcrB